MKYQISNTPVSPPDQRDINFTASGKVVPRKKELDFVAIENQGPIGTCVPNAVTSVCEYLSPDKKHLSRLAHYYMTRERTERLGQEGLFPREAYKTAYHNGLAEEIYWPYIINQVEEKPPQSVYDNAALKKVKRYESVVNPRRSGFNDVEQVIAAIADGLPVMFAMNVTDSINHMTGPWQFQQYSKLSATVLPIGRHMMVATGYDLDLGMLKVANSWGIGWGQDGYGGFPLSVIEEPFFEASVIRDFAGSRVAEVEGMFLEFKNWSTITARIITEQRGLTNLYMVALLNGQWFIRQPIPLDRVNPAGLDYTGSQDKWVPYNGGTVVPTVTGYELDEFNYVMMVQFFTALDSMKGADFYLSYGTSTEEAVSRLTKITTI